MEGKCKLANRARFEVSGPDALRFLNGQVSNELDRDLSRRVVPACLCSLKGKVEALIWITSGSDQHSYCIDAEASQADSVIERLDRYLIADDCEISEIGEGSGFHVVAEKAPFAGKECWRLGVRGFDVEQEDGPWENLPDLSEEEMTRSKLIHGIPEYDFEISGDEFPSELGLDVWAVNFHKGCYLGQEVISRIESVGKTKRRAALYLTEESFEKGRVFHNESGKEIRVVSRNSVPWEEGRFLTRVLEHEPAKVASFENLPIEFPPRQ